MESENIISFVDTTHPEYLEKFEEWQYAHDHYTLNLLKTGKLSSYLVKKAQGESTKAYEERLALADYTALFAKVAESMAGMMFSVEDKAQRFWGELLGRPEDEGSLMGDIWHNADGKGSNWNTLPKSVAIDLNIKHTVFGLVEGITADADQSVVKIIQPEQVTDWQNDTNGRMIWAKVVTHRYVRDSKHSLAKKQKQAYLYTMDGWELYENDSNGKPTVIDSGEYTYYDRTGQRTLPIFRIELPLRRNVGYYLARKNNAIFNMESSRDNILRLANFPKLIIVGKDDEFNAIASKLSEGSNAMQLNPEHSKEHKFIAPPSESAQISSEVLKEKIRDFYDTAFQAYADAAREKTATEIRQDIAEGIGAYLTLLKSAVDEFENTALFLTEQANFPNQQNKWGEAMVIRTNDFAQVDIDAKMKELKTNFFGSDTLPATEQSTVYVLERLYDYYGIEYDSDELTSAVQQYISGAQRQNDVLAGLGLGA